MFRERLIPLCRSGEAGAAAGKNVLNFAKCDYNQTHFRGFILHFVINKGTTVPYEKKS